MSNLRRTPLFSSYGTQPGVRCIDFGGWELPVQFSGIQKEHEPSGNARVYSMSRTWASFWLRAKKPRLFCNG